MSVVWDSILGTTTAAGATLTAATIASGDSLTIKNAREAWLTGIFFRGQTTAAELQIASAKMHDPTYGFYVKNLIANPQDYLNNTRLRLFPQDVLSLKISGSAVAGDIDAAVLRICYVDPDAATVGNYITAQEFRARSTGLLATVKLSLTAATTAATYGGTLALNAAANSYQLRGNTKYALIGMFTDTHQAAITVKGPDTGFLRCAIPGNKDYKFQTSSYLIDSCFQTQLPAILVIDTANAGSTVVECVNDENAATVVVNLLLMQLN